MKKTIRILLFFLLLAVACSFAAGAETVEDLYNEQLEASGGEELLRDLPDETRRLLDKLGITGLEMDTFSNLKPQSVWNQMLSLFSSQAGSPVRALWRGAGDHPAVRLDGRTQTYRPGTGLVGGVRRHLRPRRLWHRHRSDRFLHPAACPRRRRARRSS